MKLIDDPHALFLQGLVAKGFLPWMAITPSPRPQDHTSQAVLCVDRCHSEMTLTDSLKHQIVPPNTPEVTGPWTKPPASPPSVCVPLTLQIPSRRKKSPHNRAHRAWSPWCLTL